MSHVIAQPACTASGAVSHTVRGFRRKPRRCENPGLELVGSNAKHVPRRRESHMVAFARQDNESIWRIPNPWHGRHSTNQSICAVHHPGTPSPAIFITAARFLHPWICCHQGECQEHFEHYRRSQQDPVCMSHVPPSSDNNLTKVPSS